MLGNILPPYHSLQELNLDWILTKVKNILRFVPDDGAVGQILRRTAHGAEWSDEQAAGVSSVNGQTGDVVLSIPDSTSDLVNDSGFVDAAGAAAAAPVQSVNGKTGNVISWLPYFVCSTAGGTAAKKVTGGSSYGISSMSDVTAILVKFTAANSASNPTLEIDSLGALPIYQYGTTAAGGSAATTGWQAGQVVMFVYDNGAWYFIKGYNTNTTYSVDSVLCATAAATAAKTSTNAAYYVLRTGNIFEITFRYSNTKNTALTLNVNSTGAKPIYINGSPSSASNYTLPAGKYLCYYDGTAYHINTGGKAPIDITGTADGNYSASNPPPYPVTSVNGQTGAVTLSIPDSTSDLVNDSGFVDAAGAAAAAPVQSVNGQTGNVVITVSDDITQAGTYNLGDIIAPGYVTASGNYFNFWLPVKITSGLNVSSASVSGGAFYTPTGAITSGNFGSPLLSSYTKTLYGSRFEFRFASTQTQNRCGSLAITDLIITVV